MAANFTFTSIGETKGMHAELHLRFSLFHASFPIPSPRCAVIIFQILVMPPLCIYGELGSTTISSPRVAPPNHSPLNRDPSYSLLLHVSLLLHDMSS